MEGALDFEDPNWSGAFNPRGLAEILADQGLAPHLGMIENLEMTPINDGIYVLSCHVTDEPYIFKVKVNGER